MRVRARAGVASDAGRIAQVLATHLRGMPGRAIRSDPHNVRTISRRDELLWCAYSERVDGAIRSSLLVSTPTSVTGTAGPPRMARHFGLWLTYQTVPPSRRTGAGAVRAFLPPRSRSVRALPADLTKGCSALAPRSRWPE